MSADDNKQSKATIELLVATGTVDDLTRIDAAENVTSAEIKSAGQSLATGEVTKVDVVDRLAAINMLVPGSQLGPEFQDQYRRIKRPLLSNAFGKTASLVEHGNLILVTSSIPGEGKTYTAVNLALSIAQEKDKTVLLVDCDVARQGASKILGIEKITGLVDVLEAGHMTIGDVLLQTDVPNLRVLSAGKQDEYVTEMLASHRMSELVNELVTRYDDRMIIFDGPPLLSTAQTQILANLVGQIVLVIEAGKTPQSLVEDALELVPQEKAIGLVMNKNQGLVRHDEYNYGYYGHDDSNGSAKK